MARAERKARKMTRSENAVAGVHRTNEFLRHQAAPMFENKGITSQQYNVLRILRGAGQAGLPTLEVGNRMVQNTPGTTRLLDRLEGARFIERRRSPTDRRLQLCFITDAGHDLLDELDPLTREHCAQIMAPLTAAEATTLMELLERIRKS